MLISRLRFARDAASRSILTASVALLCGGCNLRDTLRTQTTVLVKVPSTQIIPKASSTDGWEFRHVLQAPDNPAWRYNAVYRGQWYVAWHPKNPIKTSFFRPYWRSLLKRTPEIADATKNALGYYPSLLEPNRTFSTTFARDGGPVASPESATEPANGAHRLTYGEGPTGAYAHVSFRGPDGRPRIDPMWHKREEYSQLASALKRVPNPGDGRRIRIAHLDNGMDGNHLGAPEHLVRGDWRANAVDLLAFAQKKGKQPLPPEQTRGSHGTGTVGLLAGGRVRIPESRVNGVTVAGYDGYLGGAPHAEVVPIKVAPWVVSISTGELAYALDYASRVKKADVISMSHGGSPTMAWVDAVNAAYDRGTAMFAASGDFFSLTFDPLRPRGILVPASPMYPAAFRRVVGVTGITADRRSYATNTLGRLLRAPRQLASWVFRGSYGADGTSTVLWRPDTEPDKSQTYNLGELRPHPIAAYAPNVPWLSSRKVNGKLVADAVDLNGGGTSAATPQVAAAAALWLQKHRPEFSSKTWRSGKKAEAVYYALLKSAKPAGGRVGADRYLGAGMLKANDALDISFADARANPNREKHPGWIAPKGSLYFDTAQYDYFEGDRSFASILGVHKFASVDYGQRASLDIVSPDQQDRAKALDSLFYNTLLLREWHGGDLPRKGRDERILRGQADRRAKAALRHEN